MKTIFWLLLTSAVPAHAYPDCYENVQRMARDKTERLKAENKLHLSEEFLWSDPAFRNYPAISWQFEVSYCPRIETVETVKDFLAEVGFNRHQVDRYFKRMVNLSDQPKYNEKLQTREYQIGREWNRIEYVLADTKDPALSIPFFAYGAAILREAKSFFSVIYLGDFNGQALVAVPYHGLTQAMVDQKPHACEEFEFAFPGVKENPVKASRTLLALPDSDIAFCSIDLAGKTLKLKPVEWSWDNKLAAQTPMLILGRGLARNKDLKVTYDNSAECKSLADDKDAVFFQENRSYPGSWRLPTGCDVSMGDSGAAAFDRNTMKWVGMVSTTNPLTYEALGGDLVDGKLSMSRMMDEGSSIVPLNKIKESLQNKLAESTAQETEVIRWLLNH